MPSIDRIRIWDSRFSSNAFAGQEYSYSAVREFNHSLTTATHGLTTWDVSVALFRNDGLHFGGESSVGSVCNHSTKGKTACNLTASEHTRSVLTHELGHAFGALHTYDAISGLCGDFRDGGSAVEIGSGITVMSYAGSGEAYDNYATYAQRYPRFHARSTQDILAYLSTVTEPMTPITNSGFTPPTVTATSPRTIPRETPFVLDVTGITTEFDAFITWEQMNFAFADPSSPRLDARGGGSRPVRIRIRCCIAQTVAPARSLQTHTELFAPPNPSK